MIDQASKRTIVQALLLAREGKWEAAHEIAQSREGHPDYDRVHALLHRIEGDEWNARYWYKRIGLNFPTISVEEEMNKLLAKYSTR